MKEAIKTAIRQESRIKRLETNITEEEREDLFRELNECSKYVNPRLHLWDIIHRWES